VTEAEILQQLERLRERVKAFTTTHAAELFGIPDPFRERPVSPAGLKAQVTDFLALAAGVKSEFTKQAQAAVHPPKHVLSVLDAVLEEFEQYVRSGLNAAISPRRAVQIEVVSDLLEQANALIEAKGVHPAAPIVLIGATLEEYLRTTMEKEGVSLGNRKSSLQGYADALYAVQLLSKQDHKDITAWAGIRNHAAHGEWEHVKDPERARLMLQSVNLFLRQHGAGN
jgi:hypothetical protein